MTAKLKDLFEKATSDSKKIIIIVLFAFTIFYLDYSLVLKAQISNLGKLSSRALKTKSDIDKLQKELLAVKDIKLKQESEGASGQEKTKKIIGEDQVPALLNEISEIANKNQIRINQIKPAKVTKDAKSLKSAKATPVSKFGGYTITLDLSSDYHHLGSFINDLENAETFLSVDDLKIVPNASDYFRQNIKLVLKTYVK
ncbi:MAG: hypothetical protein FJZ15_04300 [Candidatus Omnitrophica bacterium]|nr:hypothetical protein [Candidatus Omnitrophota bacterium]